MNADEFRRILDDAADELTENEKERLTNALGEAVSGFVMFSGRGTAEAIEPATHDADCDQVHWVTQYKAEHVDKFSDYDLDEDEAVCHSCGTSSTVVDTQTEKNVIVDKAGAETITDYITGADPADFVRMKLGSTATPSSPTEGDTQLSNTVTTSPSLTPTQQSTGGAEKKVVWSNTFASATGRSNVVSMGMDTGTATGTGANLLNRLTFTAKDNANNDLSLTYELTVS